MATERTTMHPFGGVMHFEVEDETYMHPFGGVVNGDITAAAGGTGVTSLPIAGHGGVAGEGGITGKRGGIAG